MLRGGEMKSSKERILIGDLSDICVMEDRKMDKETLILNLQH